MNTVCCSFKITAQNRGDTVVCNGRSFANRLSFSVSHARELPSDAVIFIMRLPTIVRFSCCYLSQILLEVTMNQIMPS